MQADKQRTVDTETEWVARRTSDDPFLPPIENPKGLMMKIVFYFTRRQFGKVLEPVKVFAARMPTSFGQFYGNAYKLDKKLQLPRETVVLIREQVARTNMCLFCMDTARWAVIKESLNEAKFEALERYSTSPLFTEAERAANPRARSAKGSPSSSPCKTRARGPHRPRSAGTSRPKSAPRSIAVSPF